MIVEEDHSTRDVVRVSELQLPEDTVRYRPPAAALHLLVGRGPIEVAALVGDVAACDMIAE
jgi:hypothetical protein